MTDVAGVLAHNPVPAVGVVAPRADADGAPALIEENIPEGPVCPKSPVPCEAEDIEPKSPGEGEGFVANKPDGVEANVPDVFADAEALPKPNMASRA